MATTTPMTPDQLVSALRAGGVKVVEHPGWRTNRVSGTWGPVYGSVFHHTAIATTEASVRVCFEGRPDLDGPLCTGVVDKTGTVHLVGAGRANHAGLGAQNVLDAVKAGRPVPFRGPDAVSGNAHFYGWECVNRGDGEDPWSAVQLEAMARIGAALAKHHGWGQWSAIAHKEWTARKIDPRGMSMATLRTRIAQILEDDDMPTAHEIAAAVWEHLIPNPYRLDADGKPKPTPARAYQVSEDGHYDSLYKALQAQAAQLGALRAAVTALAGGGLTAEELQAAAEAGANAALDRLGDALTA